MSKSQVYFFTPATIFLFSVLFFCLKFLIKNSMTGAEFSPWGAAISGVIGLGGAIFGANRAGKERKRIESLINQQQADNQAWYNANALGDYTQRADAQNLLRNLRENMARQNKIAANTAVVTGATPEQQAVQKEQTNKVISDTYANLGAMGQQYKDRVTDQYLNRKSALENSQLGMMKDSLNNYSTLFNNSIGQIGNAATAFAGSFGKKGDE
jgi:hypothetical protein